MAYLSSTALTIEEGSTQGMLLNLLMTLSNGISLELQEHPQVKDKEVPSMPRTSVPSHRGAVD